MMLYSIVAIDNENSLALRKQHRPAHLKRLEQLNLMGRLVVAGPNSLLDDPYDNNSGFSGSIIIAEFDSLIDAQKWAEEDPFKLYGVYQQVTVKPFRQVLP